jgi:putative colanic acid biosynthesis acetyltransferase WcaB
MGFWTYVTQDQTANANNTKGKLVAFLFRLAQYAAQRKTLRLLLLPYLALYRVMVEWFMGIELPWSVQAGPGLRVFHGQATVVHGRVVLGRNCTLRQSTTIGNSTESGGVPRIGDHVEIGANVCILGDITIGDNSMIGAGSVVVRSVPPNSVVVGNPGRVIKTLAPQT